MPRGLRPRLRGAVRCCIAAQENKNQTRTLSAETEYQEEMKTILKELKEFAKLTAGIVALNVVVILCLWVDSHLFDVLFTHKH